MKRLFCLSLAISIAGCSSTTVINSVPEGATVYLNGERVGTTPYTHSDTKIVGSSNSITLKKGGYQDFVVIFSRSEEMLGQLLEEYSCWCLSYGRWATSQRTRMK